MKHANVSVFVPHSGCPNTCSFCNQRAISGTVRVPDAAFVTRLCQDALPFIRDSAASEIAFFGGSFTAIERGLMLELLRAAHPFVKAGRFGGIRISTRPDCIDGEVLSLLRQHGITAIELGAQSMDDAVLAQNRRGHTAQDTAKAAALIREAGFELGLQMMVGLPGDTPQGAVDTAKKLAALRPSTARIYPVMVIAGTQLQHLYESGEYTPMTLEESVECCCDVLDVFGRADVRVIRLGLHSEESLHAQLIAGAYHPAFGELCYGRQYLKQAIRRLSGTPRGSAVLSVHPSCISKMTGQGACNIRALAERGFTVKVAGDAAVNPGEIRVEAQENHS